MSCDYPSFSDKGLRFWWRKHGPWREVKDSVGQWVEVEMWSPQSARQLCNAASKRKQRGWPLKWERRDLTVRLCLTEPVDDDKTTPKRLTKKHRERSYVKGQPLALATEEGWR